MKTKQCRPSLKTLALVAPRTRIGNRIATFHVVTLPQ